MADKGALDIEMNADEVREEVEQMRRERGPESSHFEVSKQIATLPQDSKYILSFKKAYDVFFAEFKEKLMLEYEQMRGSYASEIQQTLAENEGATEENLRQAEQRIQMKQIETENLKEQKQFARRTMSKLFRHKQHIYLERLAFKAWVEFKANSKRRKRLENYSLNFMYRRKMRGLFCGWRQTTHTWFKEKIDAEEESLLEQKKAVQLNALTQKVDALKVYVAQLQERIHVEMTAKEDLTKTYEGSINNGVGRFNDETKQLADNPLIKEISLIIAEQIQRKTIGQESQHFAQSLNTRE